MKAVSIFSNDDLLVLFFGALTKIVSCCDSREGQLFTLVPMKRAEIK